MSARCDVNIAGREEDCGSLIAYVPCRELAVAEAVDPRRMKELCVCEKHAAEIERLDDVTTIHRFDEEG